MEASKVNGSNGKSNGAVVEDVMTRDAKCPMCDGRGKMPYGELVQKLGLRDALDAAELTAEAVARAVDKRVLESFELARKIESERAQQALAFERERQAETERRTQDLLRRQRAEIEKLRQVQAALEARTKQAEETLAKRRHQPAVVGRIAERDFAAVVGSQPDMRVSPKLARGGDYEVWFRVDVGGGASVEVAEPVLVDVKAEDAGLADAALAKLVRDCVARRRGFGALVADNTAEVHETFGSNRVRVMDGVTVLLTTVDHFAADVRLLAPFVRQMVDAQRAGDESLLQELTSSMIDIAQLLAEVETVVGTVATALDRQANTLRKTLLTKLCARLKTILASAQQRAAADPASAA